MIDVWIRPIFCTSCCVIPHTIMLFNLTPINMTYDSMWPYNFATYVVFIILYKLIHCIKLFTQLYRYFSMISWRCIEYPTHNNMEWFQKDLSIKISVTMAGRSLFTRQQVLLRKWYILIQLSIKTRFGEFLLNIFRVYLRLKKFSYRNASYRSY